jgi:flagellar motor protein MotB
MANPYFDLLEEIQNSQVAMGAPGRGQLSSAPETKTDKALAVLEAADPQALPIEQIISKIGPMAVLGMTKWKKALNLAPEWATGGKYYPNAIREIKETLGFTESEKWKPSDNLKKGKEILAAIKESKKEARDAMAKAARLKMRLNNIPTAQDDVLEEAIKDQEYWQKIYSNSAEKNVRNYDSLLKSINTNAPKVKPQIPVIPDKRRLSQARANEVLKILEEKNMLEGAKTHAELSKAHGKFLQREKMPYQWLDMLDEYLRKKGGE